MAAYAVAYRTGGPSMCRWTRIDEEFTLAGATTTVAEMLRAGRKALIFKAVSLDAIGLPIGWEAGTVNWERDSVSIGRFHTEHVIR
jgi:hypothetical protein